MKIKMPSKIVSLVESARNKLQVLGGRITHILYIAFVVAVGICLLYLAYLYFWTDSNLPLWSPYPKHKCSSTMTDAKYFECIDQYVQHTAEDIKDIVDKQSAAIAARNKRANMLIERLEALENQLSNLSATERVPASNDMVEKPAEDSSSPTSSSAGVR